MIKKKINISIDKLCAFVPYDEHGQPRLVQCCNNKELYLCKFPGEPLAFICKSHIKDKEHMLGIERIFNFKSEKEIPIEDMGFEKEIPTLKETLQETIEKIKHENSNIQETESICIRGITTGNRLIKSYQSYIDESETTYGKDSMSYAVWRAAKRIQVDHISMLCKILLNCQTKPKKTQKQTRKNIH